MQSSACESSVIFDTNDAVRMKFMFLRLLMVYANDQ